MDFTLHIFESELKEMKDFVSRYPNIETGGDLFGLWKANGDPVVQLIIGPGKNCRRTSVSFHQDTNYLAKVGTYVNSSFMLCHIGSWHSHHQLSLMQPSTGDRSTVCNNFPEGLKRYIMIIANINRGSSQSVAIHPYMFSNGGHVCKPGSVKQIPLESPFRQIGYVLSRIADGVEQHVSAKAGFSSRAPLEYHNRPSTRSKPITGVTGNFQTGVTNTKRESKAIHQHTQVSPMHQNYFSYNGTSDRDSPMDVDPPVNNSWDSHHQSSHSQYHVTKNHQHETSPTRRVVNEEAQWYNTEKGGTILKEIIQEISTTMSRDINYHRDQYSKNLTMEFTHNRLKWIIKFPKSFGNEPAQIINSSYAGKDVLSKSVINDIRKICGCGQCRKNENIGRQQSPSKVHRVPSPPKPEHPFSHAKSPPPSPPKRDFSPPSKHVRHSRQGRHSPYDRRPQSRFREAKSPSQPWYNTAGGKQIVEEIKSKIENYLRTTNNSTRVKIQESCSKQLTFYHGQRDWIVEFINNSSKDITLKIYGERNFVKLKPPYDVVSEIKDHCVCANCRSTRRGPSAGQRRQGSAFTRPNSRYGANVDRHSPSRVSSTPSPKFFASEKGEEEFRKICNQINSLFLNGGNVDMSRHTDSRDIEITFQHNRRKWTVTFPFGFPKELSKLHFAYAYSRQNLHRLFPIPVSNGNILRAIRNNCDCVSCKRYS